MSIARVRSKPPIVSADLVRLEADLELPGTSPHRIFFEFTCPNPAAAEPVLRPFLLAALLPAMRAGLPLELGGPIDPVTRANVMEWQAAYADWRPRRLQIVPILAPTMPNRTPATPIPAGALTAFSGGVDSCFTVHQQTRPTQPDDLDRRFPLRAGLMVHGFDIPLEQDAVFESAFQNSAAILRDFGLQPFRLRTNLRPLGRALDCDWETEGHGLWLAAALACLEPWFDGIVIPSSYAYSRLRIPWGSTPITDPLLGSDRAPCWHDGARHNKFTKLLAIAHHPTVAGRVRVCWQGRQLDRNCGHCFKCIATQLCFWLADVPQPAAFPSPCTLSEVRRMPVKNLQNDFLLQALLARARTHNRPDLAHAISHARSRGRLKRSLLSLRRTLSACIHP